MAKPASEIPVESASDRPTFYEQPVSERMRTFMRLEFLYQQMLYNSELESDWATRATISSLLEIMAILSRGDVRSEVHKELDQQLSRCYNAFKASQAWIRGAWIAWCAILLKAAPS